MSLPVGKQPILHTQGYLAGGTPGMLLEGNRVGKNTHCNLA